MKTIRDILRPSFLLKVPAHAPVLHAVSAMAHHDVGIVAVVDAHALVGVFSERDVVRRVVDHGLDPAATPVSAVMTSHVVFAGIDEDVQAAMRRIDQANIRHLPVIDGGEVVSMLSIRDLLRASMDDVETELAHLRAYICDGESFRARGGADAGGRHPRRCDITRRDSSGYRVPRAEGFGHGRKGCGMTRVWLVGLFIVLGVSAAYVQSPGPKSAHFHHVHVNATDPARTQAFYEQTFGAQPTLFKGRTPALFTSRGFILINTVPQTPKDLETTAIRHIGWAGVDGPNEFAWLKAKGAQFHTPLTPLGTNWFFYLFGPDREIAEVYTGDSNHLFNHVHLSVDDLGKTAAWYERTLGMQFPASARAPKPTDPGARWGTSARLDGVSFVLIYKDHYYADSEHRLPVGRTLQGTQGSPIDHIAFSYEHIEPEFARMQAAGVTIAQPIAERADGLKSFFVTGPDAVSIEIVEAKPIPEGLWQ